MSRQYDTIVVGAGIAGLGAAAILSREAGQKVLVLDRYPKFGGRMMSYADKPEKGWRVDIGLHLVELGPHSSSHALNKRVGVDVAWGPFSRTVDIWNGEAFIDVAGLVPMSGEDRRSFAGLLRKIASLSDSEIEIWDNRSLKEWLDETVSRKSVRELFTDLGMIMTTIPEATDMAAGEVLYITRENLVKTRQALCASYPSEGMEGLTKGLVRVIRDNGGVIKLNCDVQEILFKDQKAVGVAIASGDTLYEEDYRFPVTETIHGTRVVCALPIYQLDRIIDFSPNGPMPEWWVKRITDIRHEITGLVGYVIGTSEPVIPADKLCFLTALKLKHTGLPFQAFPASNFSPDVAPPGRQVIHTDVVCDHIDASDKFRRRFLLNRMWTDIREMFPGIDSKIEWKIPYYVDGCDGLARKPGLVGNFKPGLQVPGVSNLFFAGDTYMGRGLALNSAARSAMMCADLIMEKIQG